MRISLNGEPREVEAVTLADALEALGVGAAVVAPAVNGRFVQLRARPEFQISDGDEIEVVAPMQGG
jgi:sulfur carrier protein